MQVLILGMHRSGTSALARVLNLMGLYFGTERVSTGRNAENQKGFWERRDARVLNDTILFNAGCDWDCLSAFPGDDLPDARLAEYRAAAADIVMDMDAHRPWFLKEPRLCVLLPVWRPVLEVPFCIHIHRNPLEVAHSLKVRNGIPIRAGLALWELYNRLALQASAGLPRHVVSYADLLDDPTATVASIHAALVQSGDYELRVPALRELTAFLDQELRHQRRERKSLQSVATASQLQLYAALEDGPIPSVADGSPPANCLEILRKYEASVDIDERVRHWRASNERRSEPNTKLQLALAESELRHALSNNEQARERLRTAEKRLEQGVVAQQGLAAKLSKREMETRDLATKLAIRDEKIRSSRQTLDDTLAARRDLASKVSRQQLELRELATKLAVRDEKIRSSRQTLDDTLAARRDLASKVSGQQLELRELATKLAARDEIIRSSRQTIRDTLAQRRDLAAKLSKRETELRDLAAKVATRDERLRSTRQAMEEAQGVRRDLATKLGKREVELRELGQARDGLQRDLARLRGESAALHRRATELHRDNKALDEQRRRLRDEREILQEQRDALRHYRVDVQAEAAAHRDDVRKAIWSLDAQIAVGKRRVVELEELAARLENGIGECLRSRRWRLGTGLLAANPQSLIRGRSHSIGIRLQDAVSARNATLRAPSETATHQTEALKLGLATYQPGTTDDSIAADASRRLDLSRMLFERCTELGRYRTRLAGLVDFVNQLAAIVAALRASRRWRLGDYLLSLPPRLLGQGRPLTAVDSMSELIRECRSDKSLLSDELSAPDPVDQANAGVPQSTSPAHPRPNPSHRVQTAAPADMPPVLPTPSLSSTREAIVVADGERQPAAAHPPTAVARRRPVDIVVCVHNAIDDVRQCLASVLATSTVESRLIIVNDGSDTETTVWLRWFAAKQTDIELIETDGPLGYTCAANKGLEASAADHVVLLNSDTIVPRLWLADLLDCMQSDEGLGIVGPLSNAASYQSVPDVVDGQGGWAVNDLPPGYNVDEFAELVHRISPQQFPRVDFVNGFCLMMSRQVIERIGLLDEVAFPRGYGEENDYCLRARAAGFELAIADQCFVYHGKSKSFGHAQRLALAKAGSQALVAKHGSQPIEDGTAKLKDSAALRNIREAIKSRLVPSGATPWNGNTPDGGQFDANVTADERVLFVLPVRGGSGGANSVIQEVVGMRMLGVDAKVATHVKYFKDFERFYADLLAAGNLFVFFDSDQDLLAKASEFDVIVATLWSSPAQIAPVAVRYPEKLYVYYVQDYEPWFFPNDPKSRAIAVDSYTLIPDMVLMAKTDWICRTVRERHTRDVYRVAPSLDHDIYFPPDSRTASPTKAVTIAAMIRPTTPRRAPLRTLRVLQAVTQSVDEKVSMLLFGCEPQNLTTFVRRNAPDLRLDASFENRGILPREGVAELLREADVFVDLSDYQAFGRTGLEAMACGCAVVLPAVGGVYEYAVDGDNCLVVDTTSVDDMVSAVQRVVQDSELRERVAKRALATAVGFDITRASLSELSVFRLAESLKASERVAEPATYRRNAPPVARAPERVVHVLVDATSRPGTANDALTQRVLLPLRHRALRRHVRVHEDYAVGALGDTSTDACIVYDGTILHPSEAQEVVDRCLAIKADLVYGTARAFDFGGTLSEEVAAAEILLRCATRVVVPSEALRSQMIRYNSEIVVAPPALDEALWLEDTVCGERTIAGSRDDDLRCVILGRGAQQDEAVQGALAELCETLSADTLVPEQGDAPVQPQDGMPAAPEYRDRVGQLRARNRWDIGLLLADEGSYDADLGFLSLAALGCSIVCSSRGAHSSIARHRDNAIVVDNTREAWTEGLRLLATDESVRAAVRDQAKLDLDTHHLLNRLAPAYLHAYVGDDPSSSGKSSEPGARGRK